MALVPQRTLFSWDFLKELPDLARIRLVVENVPDEVLVRKLETRRGRAWPRCGTTLPHPQNVANSRRNSPYPEEPWTWRPMVYKGYEADREALKYICPAKAYGTDCPCVADCPATPALPLIGSHGIAIPGSRPLCYSTECYRRSELALHSSANRSKPRPRINTVLSILSPAPSERDSNTHIPGDESPGYDTRPLWGQENNPISVMRPNETAEQGCLAEPMCVIIPPCRGRDVHSAIASCYGN